MNSWKAHSSRSYFLFPFLLISALHLTFFTRPELCAQTCAYLATGKAKELRGRYIDVVKDIESLVEQAEIVKRENLYDMGIKELGG